MSTNSAAQEFPRPSWSQPFIIQQYPYSWNHNPHCCHCRRGFLLRFRLHRAPPWPLPSYLITHQNPSSIVGSPNPGSQLKQGKVAFPWRRATGEEEEAVRPQAGCDSTITTGVGEFQRSIQMVVEIFRNYVNERAWNIAHLPSTAGGVPGFESRRQEECQWQLTKSFLSPSILSSYLWIAEIFLHHPDCSLYTGQQGYIGWNGWNFIKYVPPLRLFSRHLI